MKVRRTYDDQKDEILLMGASTNHDSPSGLGRTQRKGHCHLNNETGHLQRLHRRSLSAEATSTSHGFPCCRPWDWTGSLCAPMQLKRSRGPATGCTKCKQRGSLHATLHHVQIICMQVLHFRDRPLLLPIVLFLYLLLRSLNSFPCGVL